MNLRKNLNMHIVQCNLKRIKICGTYVEVVTLPLELS
jgi:hypothetical protein